MALADSTFKLYEEDTLTTLTGNLLSVANKTDLSDVPKDYVKYFGSNTANRQLHVDSDYGSPGVDNITLTPTDILPSWVTATVYSVAGYKIEPSTPNGMRYRLKTTGTSGGTEPTWPTTGIGSEIADGTCVWVFEGAKHATTEVILALNEADLDTNTPGASLNLGHTILSTAAEAIPIYIRIVNAVTVVSTGRDLALFVNNIQEEAV